MWLLSLWSDNIVITLERKDEGLKYVFGYGNSITEVWRDIWEIKVRRINHGWDVRERERENEPTMTKFSLLRDQRN